MKAKQVSIVVTDSLELIAKYARGVQIKTHLLSGTPDTMGVFLKPYMENEDDHSLIKYGLSIKTEAGGRLGAEVEKQLEAFSAQIARDGDSLVIARDYYIPPEFGDLLFFKHTPMDHWIYIPKTGWADGFWTVKA